MSVIGMQLLCWKIGGKVKREVLQEGECEDRQGIEKLRRTEVAIGVFLHAFDNAQADSPMNDVSFTNLEVSNLGHREFSHKSSVHYTGALGLVL